MFDVFAKLLSSLATFLFPVFASYKALKGHDPAQLSPWLMYWVVLACVLLVESWTEWLLVWFPFYQWIRASVLLYLVLPQTQGAVVVYQTHIHPFLNAHETEIEDFISSAHDRARAAGLQYLKHLIDLVKEHVFGIQQKQQATPPPSGTYAQTLLARFNLPSMRGDQQPANPRAGATAAASDLYTLLASTLSQVTAPSSSAAAAPSTKAREEAQAEALSASGTLIPSSLQDDDARLNYISTQRKRLGVLMRALDNEAVGLARPARSAPAGAAATLPGALSAGEDEPLAKRKSETDFEKVERDEISAATAAQAAGKDAPDAHQTPASPSAAGGWMPWNWGGTAGRKNTTIAGTDKDGLGAESASRATATGMDASSP